MISDEGQIKAARVMTEAAQNFSQNACWLQETLERTILQLEQVTERFEASVERLIIDWPGEV